MDLYIGYHLFWGMPLSFISGIFLSNIFIDFDLYLLSIYLIVCQSLFVQHWRRFRETFSGWLQFREKTPPCQLENSLPREKQRGSRGEKPLQDE